MSPAEHNKPLVENVNTSAAERLNSLMSRHPHVVRCIRSGLMRDFFVQEIADSRNRVAGAGEPTADGTWSGGGTASSAKDG